VLLTDLADRRRARIVAAFAVVFLGLAIRAFGRVE
jgi:hypothetical protein